MNDIKNSVKIIEDLSSELKLMTQLLSNSIEEELRQSPDDTYLKAMALRLEWCEREHVRHLGGDALALRNLLKLREAALAKAQEEAA